MYYVTNNIMKWIKQWELNSLGIHVYRTRIAFDYICGTEESFKKIINFSQVISRLSSSGHNTETVEFFKWMHSYLLVSDSHSGLWTREREC